MTTKISNSGIVIHPIGHVRAEGESFSIHIDKEYRPGLSHLDQFSHFLVVWWASEHDNPESRAILQTELPYADNLRAGVFACRSEYRPNPIAISVCACLHMDKDAGVIQVPYLDAFDRTPVIDLKPYFPVSERVREVKVPPWVENWPQWYEEAHKLAELFEACES
jgi:tRNA-Thr(GGU) m(6)t(6)A37 methyltransferase TsaA